MTTGLYQARADLNTISAATKQPPARSAASLVTRFITLGIIGAALAIAISWFVVGRAGDGRVYNDAAQLPSAEVVIVPGALVYSNGQPSDMLADRVDAAVNLYRNSVVTHLLVSGDNSVERYNEPVAMRTHAMNQQIPLADITLDYAGVDTYDTCLRAKEQFGVSSAIIVTQKLYASRTAAVCEAAGLDIAVLAIDPPPLDDQKLWLGRARETLANVKAVGDLVRKPNAKFGGEFIGLVGSVDMPEGGHPPDWDWHANAPA